MTTRYLAPLRASSVPDDATRARASEIMEHQVRPALRRLLDGLRNDLLAVARADDRVGVCFVPGGEEGYRAAVRRHTTTELEPQEIHEIGLSCVADLRTEWAEVGRRALGTADRDEIFARLRTDPALRFSSSADIVATGDAGTGACGAGTSGLVPRPGPSRTA